MTVTTYNPFDPDAVDEQYDRVAELRSGSPVSEFFPGAFFVARHADVLRVTHDPATFPQGGMSATTGEETPLDRRALFELDPPDHGPIRRRFTGALSPGRVKALEPMVRSTCAELVDRIAAGGPADLVADLGVPLPALVISQLAGLEAGDATAVREYCDDFVSAVADPSALDADGLTRCAHFEDELRVRIATRRAAITVPDDLLTALAVCPGDDGAPISVDRVLTHLTKDVFIGGLETTTHLIGNLFFEILTTDGLYDRLRADRSLVPAAVEESLRHLSPVQIAMRRVATETELAGTTLPSGGIVVLGLGSANRDEAVFTEPDRYDVDRDEAELRSHVAFDRGIHACVGAGLVRLEARVALETVLDRFPRLELAPGATYERVRHFMMRGPSAVVVAPDV